MPENIISGTVNFGTNGGTADGYLAHPIDPGSYPALIVIQEWWGVDAHIRDVTERFARLGFAAIAPDLYHGQVTSEPDAARKMAMSLEYDRAAKEIDSAADWLLQQPYARGPKFGCIGYCMGGGLVLTTAMRNEGVAAGIVYYGGLPNPPERLQDVRAPILAFYGDGEAERGRQLKQILEQHNRSVQLHIYEGAAHGFFNDTNKGGYDLAAAYDTWPRAIQFLREHLP